MPTMRTILPMQAITAQQIILPGTARRVLLPRTAPKIHPRMKTQKTVTINHMEQKGVQLTLYSFYIHSFSQTAYSK
jgi:hypothetical protein